MANKEPGTNKLYAEDHQTDEMRWFELPQTQNHFDDRWRRYCEELGVSIPDDSPYVTANGSLHYDFDEDFRCILSVIIGTDRLGYAAHFCSDEDSVRKEQHGHFLYEEYPTGLPGCFMDVIREWLDVVRRNSNHTRTPPP